MMELVVAAQHCCLPRVTSLEGRCDVAADILDALEQRDAGSLLSSGRCKAIKCVVKQSYVHPTVTSLPKASSAKSLNFWSSVKP